MRSRAPFTRRNVSRASSASHRVPSRRSNSSAAQVGSVQLRELVAKSVAEIEQVLGVLRRVVEHALRERSHRPVGALMLLVELHAEEPLEQRGQTERANAEQLCGDARVEDVRDSPAVVLMEQPQIVVGVVKDDFDVARLEQAPEPLGNSDRERDRGSRSLHASRAGAGRSGR